MIRLPLHFTRHRVAYLIQHTIDSSCVPWRRKCPPVHSASSLTNYSSNDRLLHKLSLRSQEHVDLSSWSILLTS